MPLRRRATQTLALGLVICGLFGVYLGWQRYPQGPAPSPAIENRLPVPVGGHVLHFGEAARHAMTSAGMTWVKWQIPYREGEDLTVARDRINWTHQAGFLVLLSITGEIPALGEGGETYLDAYAAFLGEVAGLGADAIEVWNEMNTDREWPSGQIDPVLMRSCSRRRIPPSKPPTPIQW